MIPPTSGYGGTTMRYEVRGPDPDGDWFVVQIDGDDETAFDEVFSSEADAAKECAALNAKSARPA